MRELIVLDANFEQDFGHIKQTVRMCVEWQRGLKPEITGSSFLVREVNPRLDQAIEGMVAALELGITGKPETGLESYVLTTMKQALSVYRAALKEDDKLRAEGASD